MLSDVRAIAFDLDNTLWDLDPVLVRAEMRLNEWLGRHCPRITATLSAADMRDARAALARAEPHNAHDVTYLRLTTLTAHAREHGYHESLARQGFEVFLEERNRVVVLPDVVPALECLARHYRLASFSNGNADLTRIGLDQLFTLSLNARSLGAAKPERRCFEVLAARLGLAPHEVLHVGDDPQLDIVAARAAGLKTAWMNRSAREWPPRIGRADLVVADCTALVTALGVRC